MVSSQNLASQTNDLLLQKSFGRQLASCIVCLFVHQGQVVHFQSRDTCLHALHGRSSTKHRTTKGTVGWSCAAP
jgi:Zn-finger protein